MMPLAFLLSCGLASAANLAADPASAPAAAVEPASPARVQRVEQVNVTRLEKGHLLPDISGIDIADGQTRKLSDWRGKTVLLVFSGTHCGACRAEHEQIEALATRWAAQGLVKVTVMSDRREDVLKLFQEHPHSGTTLLSPGGWKSPAFTAFNVHGIPAHCLIGPDGRVAAGDLNGDELAKAVAQHFGGAIQEPSLSPRMAELRLALAGQDQERLRLALVALRSEPVVSAEFVAVFQRHLQESPRRHQLACLLARSYVTPRDVEIPVDLELLFAHAAYDIGAWPMGDTILAELQRRWAWQDSYPECRESLRREPASYLDLKRRRAILLQDHAGAVELLGMMLKETRRPVQDIALAELADLAGEAAAQPLRDWLKWQTADAPDPARVIAAGPDLTLTYEAQGTPFEENLELEALIQADDSQWFRVPMHHNGSRHRWVVAWSAPQPAKIVRVKFIDELERCDNRKRQITLPPKPKP